MSKRVLILSDSLAAPRTVGNQVLVEFEKTWPTLLKTKHPDLELAQVSMGHATIDFVLAQCKYWVPFNPDIVIVQAGLNDCLPRALHKFEMEFIDKIDGTFVGRKLGSFVHKKRFWLRKIRGINYTNERKFERNLQEFKKYFSNLVWVNLVFSEGKKLNQFPDKNEVKKNVSKYNSIIKSVFQDSIIDLSCVPEEFVLDDAFHLNHNGHYYAYERILKEVLR
jgi:hypothetical protein